MRGNCCARHAFDGEHSQHCPNFGGAVSRDPAKVGSYSISPDRTAVTVRFDRALDKRELIELLRLSDRLGEV